MHMTAYRLGPVPVAQPSWFWTHNMIWNSIIIVGEVYCTVLKRTKLSDYIKKDN
jgi:hypothetical protein